MLQNPFADSLTSWSHEAYREPTFSFDDAVRCVKDGQNANIVVQRLLTELTKAEKLGLLDGDVPFWEGLRSILCDRYNRNPFVHGEVLRLGIPGIKFTDGPRGVVMGASTAFPVSMSRGATWDLSIEEEIGQAIGLEGRAQGANYFAGICINLPRHPAWGRIQETYSEDPLLLGEFGLALHNGVKNHMMTCVKHFALNSMENARFRVDVSVDDAALHEVYLPHFKRLVEGGVSSIMSSYNSVRGEFAGQNKELLTDILRDLWGFDGFVLSDFIFGLRDAALSLRNGLDIEAPFRQQRAQSLQHCLESDRLTWDEVDRACSRILKKQVEHVSTTGTTTPDSSVIFCEKHRNLSRKAAATGMVLLKNEPVGQKPLLPIDASVTHRIAVIGRLANAANTGDKGSSAVFAPQVITAFEGIRDAFPRATVVLEDSDSAARAEAIAAKVDLVICLVGYNSTDEGEYVVPSFETNPELLELFPEPVDKAGREMWDIVQGRKPAKPNASEHDSIVPGAGGDRKSLRLRDTDVEIITALDRANPNLVVAMVGAGAIIVEEWIDKVPALLMTWYSGSEGGHALGDVLLGTVDATGRMPFSTPTCESHLPHFDIDAAKITYDRWFGQRLLDRLQVSARFPLGFGLSYTSFALSDLEVQIRHDGKQEKYLEVSTMIQNIGTRPGRFVGQVYGCQAVDNFPARVLLGFQPIHLTAGQRALLRCRASIRPLQQWQSSQFVLTQRTVRIEMSSYSGDPNSLSTLVDL